MCGISIAINKNIKDVSLKQIKNLNDKVSHRGPDDEGFYFGKNFAFGHRRLSILDLSPAGHQPMNRENLWITYNGEIYNYIELRKQLIDLGHTFTTKCDTEVILIAYKEWGVDSFRRMNGMWAFCIYDEKINNLIFSRDHFGIKPLYYTQFDDWFVAGSEIKQFTEFENFQPKLNKKIALNFLAQGLLNYSEETFFEGVNELRPGHMLEYNLDTHDFTITKWYNLKSSSKKIKDDFETAVEKVRSFFTNSLQMRMRSDVKVGSCLSGGIDSSSIVSCIHKNELSNPDFATITSCYKDKRYDEQTFSDLVSDQTKFLAIKVYPELNDLWQKSEFDNIIYHQDQPIGSASHYSEYKVFETARKHNMIVMLDGQGSDEYLCGYGEFFLIYMNTLLHRCSLLKMYNLLKIRAKQKKISFFKELIQFIQSQFYFQIVNKLKNIIGRTRYSYLTNESQIIMGMEAANFNANNIRDLSINEIMYSSIPYQLHSEDRNSMLFSIESRLPFLDHEMVEYVIGLPDDYKIRNGYTKFILREAISELPNEIKERKDKMGFVAPDREWIKENKVIVRKELKDLVAQNNIFSEDLLLRFDKFINGKLDYEPVYFRAMAFSRFCKIFKINM